MMHFGNCLVARRSKRKYAAATEHLPVKILSYVICHKKALGMYFHVVNYFDLKDDMKKVSFLLVKSCEKLVFSELEKY